ncbi:Subtilisin-like protease SBT1.7 [Striga hermonthica]|uniref:Subtilisin-like protease SBT1.7 n=1 Tax=Striga hermonthica TaxID=68872 RepID=A0A9N7P1S4_STRHE|nr:Subtilisin-like protease SBT1.7 [Striga hermonthica]
MGKQVRVRNIYAIGIALLLLSICRVTAAQKKTYIIQMAKDKRPVRFSDHGEWYDSSLQSVSDTAKRIHTYQHVFGGFSVRLTTKEADNIKKLPWVISIFPEAVLELHTTRSPWFLGLQTQTKLFPEPEQMGEVVVGLLDTGVWPESPSFNDYGFGPIPSSWKGECIGGTNFSVRNCNKKLIGAKFFVDGYEAYIDGKVNELVEFRSPRDHHGHGTHTATIAAGSAVRGANLLGHARGMARGMVPSARVAMYKVCWGTGFCAHSDILAGMDSAINDGVTVLSISIGGNPRIPFYPQPAAIGAFSAVKKGIPVIFSAANNGPNPSSVANAAPWVTTAGAGTIDRDFPAYVNLGNGKSYYGVTLSESISFHRKLFPFVYAANVSSDGSGLCRNGTLLPEKVRGKIVLCDRGNDRALRGAVVKEAGGVAMVMANTVEFGEGRLFPDPHFLPALLVGEKAGDEIKKYLSTSRNARATMLFLGTRGGVQPAPMVADFSSRGPSPFIPEILKPDIIAPGLTILAGWSRAVGPTNLDIDHRRVDYNIISGTSMSCPHISGLTALLKAAHPDWSPAAIRSALMTTAYSTDKKGSPLLDESTGEPATPFDYGAGHVDPTRALNPGLIYNLTTIDYVKLLCALNYSDSEIESIVGETSFNCEDETCRLYDFNYPSFALTVPAQKGSNTTRVFTRTLTNVGEPGIYTVSISFHTLINNAYTVSVFPSALCFTEENEKKSYVVIVTAMSMPAYTNQFARIEWRDGKHVVQSPFAISWINATQDNLKVPPSSPLFLLKPTIFRRISGKAAPPCHNPPRPETTTVQAQSVRSPPQSSSRVALRSQPFTPLFVQPELAAPPPPSQLTHAGDLQLPHGEPEARRTTLSRAASHQLKLQRPTAPSHGHILSFSGEISQLHVVRR